MYISQLLFCICASGSRFQSVCVLERRGRDVLQYMQTKPNRSPRCNPSAAEMRDGRGSGRTLARYMLKNLTMSNPPFRELAPAHTGEDDHNSSSIALL